MTNMSEITTARIKHKRCEHYKRFPNFDPSRRTNTESSIEFPYIIYVCMSIHFPWESVYNFNRVL